MYPPKQNGFSPYTSRQLDFFSFHIRTNKIHRNPSMGAAGEQSHLDEIYEFGDQKQGTSLP
jgi:hypothetical protein